LQESERDQLLAKWRKGYCETSEDIARKLEELANEEFKEVWIRSSPADIYYKRSTSNTITESTTRLDTLCDLFDTELIHRTEKAIAKQKPYLPPSKTRRIRLCRHKSKNYLYN